MVKNQGSLCVISAPSGAGKSSLIQSLKKNNCLFLNTQLSISYTTRKQRSEEINGKDYYFISSKKFKYMINNNMFLEYAKIFNNYYGTEKNNIKIMLDSGVHVILNIDWQGVKQLRSTIFNLYTIFILPPSRKELERRLRIRGQDTYQVITNRMKKAISEINHFREYDYIIVNDNFNTALIHLRSIVLSEQLRLVYQEKKYNTLINDLLSTNI